MRSSTDALKSLHQNNEGRIRGRKRQWPQLARQPELIKLMKAVLDDAAAMLPEAKRTSTMKAEIASHILACAAKGERNPTTLKIAALSAVVSVLTIRTISLHRMCATARPQLAKADTAFRIRWSTD